MYESQPNSEEKVNPGILKDDFSSRTDQSIFTSIQPMQWNQQVTCYHTPQCPVDQIEVQKPIVVAAKDQMPDHT